MCRYDKKYAILGTNQAAVGITKAEEENGGVRGVRLTVDGCMGDGDSDGSGHMEAEGRRGRWCWGALLAVKGRERRRSLVKI